MNNPYVNINGIWNLVLTDSKINLEKGAKLPDINYLEKLFYRNEFYIESKHPLGETIANQTGKTKTHRINFLKVHYENARNFLIHTWKPSIRLPDQILIEIKNEKFS